VTQPRDPLEVLRDEGGPVAPDPAFAARLRSRLTRALSLPKGVTVSDLQLSDLAESSASGATAAAAAPTGRPAGAAAFGPLVPYLAVAGGRDAIRFYGAAFGARLVGKPYEGTGGGIGHADLELPGGARLMLSDEAPALGVVAPTAGENSVSLHLTVPDVDAALDAAVEAGAEVARPAADYEYGRNAVLRDPFGHRWMLTGPTLTGIRHGDLGYVSLWVPDAERTATLLADVLGWQYAPAGRPDGRARQVVGQSLSHGLLGDQPRSTLYVCVATADIEATRAAVVAAGGEADATTDEPYGLLAMCRDDQGVAFAAYQPPQGVSAAARPAESKAGDLIYVTYEVADSARFRQFYGTVFGWEFQPGRVPDGWQITNVQPMGGMRGGVAEATIVPAYQVADIDQAVARVRAGGGEATDPEEQGYGWSATCDDGQGTRFYLIGPRRG